jgi:hypothetical protein
MTANLSSSVHTVCTPVKICLIAVINHIAVSTFVCRLLGSIPLTMGIKLEFRARGIYSCGIGEIVLVRANRKRWRKVLRTGPKEEGNARWVLVLEEANRERSTDLRNVDIQPPHNTAQQPRKKKKEFYSHSHENLKSHTYDCSNKYCMDYSSINPLRYGKGR